ncbi:MAG: phosphoribosyltransferase family protein [bacterium]
MTNVIDILKKVGALISDDHFVGTSGLHMDTYINKDALYPHTKETSEVGKLFGEKYKDKNIDVVVAPALGGIILSQWTAHHLSELNNKDVLGIYTEKTPEGGQVFTRGYDKYVNGKNILIVEDLTTTGGSVMKVVEAVKEKGGNVVGVCVMVNKNPKTVNSDTLGIPFDSLAEYPVAVYEAKDCPLCRSGIPVNITIGHGKKFVESQLPKKDN